MVFAFVSTKGDNSTAAFNDESKPFRDLQYPIDNFTGDSLDILVSTGTYQLSSNKTFKINIDGDKSVNIDSLAIGGNISISGVKINGITTLAESSISLSRCQISSLSISHPSSINAIESKFSSLSFSSRVLFKGLYSSIFSPLVIDNVLQLHLLQCDINSGSEPIITSSTDSNLFLHFDNCSLTSESENIFDICRKKCSIICEKTKLVCQHPYTTVFKFTETKGKDDFYISADDLTIYNSISPASEVTVFKPQKDFGNGSKYHINFVGFSKYKSPLVYSSSKNSSIVHITSNSEKTLQLLPSEKIVYSSPTPTTLILPTPTSETKISIINNSKNIISVKSSDKIDSFVDYLNIHPRSLIRLKFISDSWFTD